MGRGEGKGAASSEQQNSVLGIGAASACAPAVKLDKIDIQQKIDAEIPDTPNERLRNLLDEAAALTRGTDEYLRKCTSPPSDAAVALERKTFETDWSELYAQGETMFEFSSRWTTDVVE